MGKSDEPGKGGTMTRFMQVALALIHQEDCWLVGKRSAGRVYAGLWEFPGGKMLAGETPECAAVREAHEEVGLDVEPVAVLGAVENADGDEPVMLHLVHCRPLAGEAKVGDPAVEEVRWVSRAELATLTMPAINRIIIADFLPA